MNTKLILFILLILLIALIVFSTIFLIKQILIDKNLKWTYPENNPSNTIKKEKIFNPSDLIWGGNGENKHWQVRDSHAAYVFNKKIFLLGGLNGTLAKTKYNNNIIYEKAKYYNDIWLSYDGKNWERIIEHADFPPIRSASVVDFNGALFMIGGWSPITGYKNGIWKSDNGIDWIKVVKQVPWEEREGQKIIEFNKKLWLIGGVNYILRKTFNDVWVSDDGLHWELVATSTGWEPRWDHDIAVFHNKIWIMGGMNLDKKNYSDIWKSEDGKNWILVNSKAPWGKRQGHGLIVFKDLMWLIGGLVLDDKNNEDNNEDNKENLNNVWYSSDGENWKHPETKELWKTREDHTVIVFNDKIWILGGMDKDFNWTNDIWYSEFKSKTYDL